MVINSGPKRFLIILITIIMVCNYTITYVDAAAPSIGVSVGISVLYRLMTDAIISGYKGEQSDIEYFTDILLRNDVTFELVDSDGDGVVEFHVDKDMGVVPYLLQFTDPAFYLDLIMIEAPDLDSPEKLEKINQFSYFFADAMLNMHQMLNDAEIKLYYDYQNNAIVTDYDSIFKIENSSILGYYLNKYDNAWLDYNNGKYTVHTGTISLPQYLSEHYSVLRQGDVIHMADDSTERIVPVFIAGSNMYVIPQINYISLYSMQGNKLRIGMSYQSYGGGASTSLGSWDVLGTKATWMGIESEWDKVGFVFAPQLSIGGTTDSYRVARAYSGYPSLPINIEITSIVDITEKYNYNVAYDMGLLNNVVYLYNHDVYPYDTPTVWRLAQDYSYLGQTGGLTEDSISADGLTPSGAIDYGKAQDYINVGNPAVSIPIDDGVISKPGDYVVYPDATLQDYLNGINTNVTVLVDSLAQLAQQETDTDIDTLPQSLMDKFPFCIPFDLYRLVNVLVAEPVQPEFIVSFSNAGHDNIMFQIDEHVTIDLSMFGAIRIICNSLSVMIFCAALWVVTNKLIGR
jgi:hypothetical protein